MKFSHVSLDISQLRVPTVLIDVQIRGSEFFIHCEDQRSYDTSSTKLIINKIDTSHEINHWRLIKLRFFTEQFRVLYN